MKKLIAFVSLGFVTSCAFASVTEYTLYRTGIDMPTKAHDETLRIHVATFDADQDAKYNLVNCEFAQELFNLFGSNSPPLAANELTRFGLIPRSLLRGCSSLVNRIIAGVSTAPSRSSIGAKRGISKSDPACVRRAP